MIRLIFRVLLLAATWMAVPEVQAGFLFTTNADGTSVTITGYTNGVPNVLVIPTNINGLTVTAIGENAFAEVNNLTNVTIPNTVTTVGEGAFNASGLINIMIPYGVSNIGEGAFADCEKMTNAVIPDSVTSIGQGAFADTELTSVTVPASVTNFGDGAFSVGESLTNVVIESGITSFGPGYLFSSTMLGAITIPESVTNLGEGTFQMCIDLTNVFFGGNAPLVDNTVFKNGSFDGVGPTTFYYIATAYYLPGTSGWAEFSSNTIITPSENYGVPTNIFVPAVEWNPIIHAADTNFGIQNGQYGFDVTGTTNLPIAIEACDDLSQSNWVVLKRLTLTNGLFHFSEPFQINSPARFYRIGFP
jgi:hypothetical protein